ncbi:hypothetical protein NQ317_017338 [Molorchus minor]|uniref:Uncharacterized protein n=1 Tax=Molorchus minor TaxID=1323400 RepID=A0ABQ9J5H7_9CUCU|nr:hypothetical protein NQ317_017338 [Molorchus minor]
MYGSTKKELHNTRNINFEFAKVQIGIPYSFKIYMCITIKQVCHAAMEDVTCSSCVGMVTSYVNFATTCEGTEERINLYREILQDKDIVKLGNVLTFLGEGILYDNVNIKKEGILDSLRYDFKGPNVEEELKPTDSIGKCMPKKCRTVQDTEQALDTTCYNTRIFQKCTYLNVRCRCKYLNVKCASSRQDIEKALKPTC